MKFYNICNEVKHDKYGYFVNKCIGGGNPERWPDDRFPWREGDVVEWEISGPKPFCYGLLTNNPSYIESFDIIDVYMSETKLSPEDAV